MNRRMFDTLMTTAGLLVAAIMLVAGGLLTWGHNFVDSNVHSQLAAQKIFFPTKGSPELASPQIGPYLNKYSGQQMTNGAQAEAYANHYIAVHLQKIGGGLTYSQLSAKAIAQPTDTKLAAQVDTTFKGQTLRGLLLNAYAFWKMGQIALYAAIAAFAGGVIMLILAALGFVHLRRAGTEPSVPTTPTLAPTPV